MCWLCAGHLSVYLKCQKSEVRIILHILWQLRTIAFMSRGETKTSLLACFITLRQFCQHSTSKNAMCVITDIGTETLLSCNRLQNAFFPHLHAVIFDHLFLYIHTLYLIILLLCLYQPLTVL